MELTSEEIERKFWQDYDKIDFEIQLAFEIKDNGPTVPCGDNKYIYEFGCSTSGLMKRCLRCEKIYCTYHYREKDKICTYCINLQS